MDHAVVMAGGSGTRFWPESREGRSKQFLDLTGRGPMLAETVGRLRPLFRRENIWVVAGEKDRRHVNARTLGIPRGNVLLEPEGRNTAPALAFAAARIARKDADAVIAATPADHAVKDGRAFRRTLAKGLALAGRTGRFVTLGVAPSHPATGYGYIERGKPFGGLGEGVYNVREFTEKPDLATARRFVRSGRYDWNSGIFLFRVSAFRASLSHHLPAVHAQIEKAFRWGGTKAFRGRLATAYRRIPSISVDYGILEKEGGILVIPAAFGWTDLGTWRSLHEFLGGTEDNVTFGNVVLSDCRGSLVRTDSGLVAVVGMQDVIVVRSGDAVLVCPRSRSEEVKRIAEKVRRGFPGFA